MIIETDRLTLAELQIEDALFILEQLSGYFGRQYI